MIEWFGLVAIFDFGRLVYSNFQRIILYKMSQVFDPLGRACLMKAKFFLQSLWIYNLPWEDETPAFICEGLTALSKMRCPRNAFRTSPPDVSKISKPLWIFGRFHKGLRGVPLRSSAVFIATFLERSSCPVKTFNSQARALRSRYSCQSVGTHHFIFWSEFDEVVLWTDSTIALSWFRMQLNQLYTFIANRVAPV